MRPTATKPTKSAPAPKATKPPANQAKKRDIDVKMIIDTFNALTDAADEKQNGHGFAVATIKTHITKNYGLRMGKERLVIFKKVMAEEFEKGNIRMTNHDGEKINFSKRFDLADESETEADDSVEADEQ